MRRLLALFVVVGAAAAAQAASASQVVSTSTVAGVRLAVNDKGEALLTYRSGGKVVHLLAWGAENALPPAPGGKVAEFDLDYSGGFDKYSSKYWKTGFGGSCGRYDGPKLAWRVAACKAPDGSYWAVQSWQRMLPNYGEQATAAQAAWEVHLSHWAGALPVLTVATDWAWHRWEHLYGTFTYDGAPVYGFSSDSSGVPKDKFGRNLYVDTFDSAYGRGWLRENSFLTHKNTGVFCYSFNPRKGHPAGNGTKYRATIMGPGVTPDVMWKGVPPGAYDKAADAEANTQIAALHDRLCRPN